MGLLIWLKLIHKLDLTFMLKTKDKILEILKGVYG